MTWWWSSFLVCEHLLLFFGERGATAPAGPPTNTTAELCHRSHVWFSTCWFLHVHSPLPSLSLLSYIILLWAGRVKGANPGSDTRVNSASSFLMCHHTSEVTCCQAVAMDTSENAGTSACFMLGINFFNNQMTEIEDKRWKKTGHVEMQLVVKSNESSSC